ncbi:MAG: threonine synthase [Flavobacteriaceae bacterium]
MEFYSLENKSLKATFKEAVIKGIASDKGLFFPSKITPLSVDFWMNIETYSHTEIAYELIHQFVDHIEEEALRSIIDETLSFDFPVIKIEDNIYTLELFNGPTMAFKDVGARFMARCFQHFKIKNEVTVLVATSGDTGGAVANGFLNVAGVNVVILYPKGKVSEIQEKQLTTLGKNITALEVDGVFDDCQDMVKAAFLDTDITDEMQLTSANSINVARWLPQMFYFAFAYKELKKLNKEVVFSIPSGNFGNICAGFMAQQLGMPIKKMIAATNLNDVVPNYLLNGDYVPKKSIQTISNAMDVGNPSNFVRIQEIFKSNLKTIKKHLKSYSFTDYETRETIKKIHKESNYIVDPHGAVGYLGLKKYELEAHEVGVFLETAHPVKFLDVVAPLLNIDIEIPSQIKAVMDDEKVAIEIKDYNELKRLLLNKL